MKDSKCLPTPPYGVRKNILKLITLILVTAMLIGTASAAVIDEETLDLNAIKTTQHRTICVTALINTDDIVSVSFRIMSTPTQVIPLGYIFGGEVEPYEVTVEADEQEYIVTYAPGISNSADVGDAVIQFYYNTTQSYYLPNMSHFYTELISCTVEGSTIPNSNYIIFEAGQMGDLDANGETEAYDALLALQASVGKITLTDSQSRLADTDLDRNVDGGDALTIEQFSVGKITGILGYEELVPVTYEPASAITDGRVYRIKNIFSGKYLTSTTTSSTQKSYSSRSDLSVKYRFHEQSDGTYKIESLHSSYSGKYLTLNYSTGHVYLANSQTSAKQYWHVVNYNNEGYVFINDYIVQNNLYTNLYLSSDGETSSNAPIKSIGNLEGFVWKIDAPPVTISSFYDYGYNVRYGSGNTSTTAQEISELNSWAEGIFETVFDVNINIDASPTLVASYADECKGVANITSSNVTQACSHLTTACDMLQLCTHALNGQAISNCTSSCADRYHHNCPDKIYSVFKKYKNDSLTCDVGVLWSGYNKCADTSGGGSMASYSAGTTLLMDFSGTDDKRRSLLHELGHAIGNLHDSYCNEKTNGETLLKDCTVTHCYRHGGSLSEPYNCIMGNVNGVSLTDVENIFCSVCKERFIESFY